jgi:hypothetical protein
MILGAVVMILFTCHPGQISLFCKNWKHWQNRVYFASLTIKKSTEIHTFREEYQECVNNRDCSKALATIWRKYVMFPVVKSPTLQPSRFFLMQ